MARDNSALVEGALDLAWSHWTGLGVRGAAVAPETAVDPEALMYLTMTLGDLDPRLRSEALDWWGRFQHHVSRSRLNHLAPEFPGFAVERLGQLEADLARGVSTSGKSRLDRLDHPSRSLLRLRCAVGPNARAEILLALATQWRDGDGVTAAALTEIGYSKRNIALVLEDLLLAGLVTAAADANRTKYRLRDVETFRKLLPSLPLVAGRWHYRMPIIASFVELAMRVEGKSPALQAIEARKLFAHFTPRFATLGIGAPGAAAPDTYWDEIQRWLVENVIRVADHHRRRMPRMLEGVWIGPGERLRTPPQFSSAVLPTLGTDPDRDPELLCLDLVQVPTVEPANDWVWLVLSEAAVHTYAHTSGLLRGEVWHFATWSAGELRTYRAALAPSLHPPKLAPVYGELAASAARKNSPAVQLRLTRVAPGAINDAAS